MRAVDRAPEAAFDQEWQITGVVDVSVADDDGRDLARRELRLQPVPEAKLFHALKQPAIQEDLLSPVPNEVLRSSHGPGGSEELKGRRSGHEERLSVRFPLSR